MWTVLESFGNMARKVLVEGRLGNDHKPIRIYRIEMTLQSQQMFMKQLEEKNPEAAEIARELLRRAVFHPLRESRGKEGADTTTVRWELRSIFRPSLGLPLESSESYLDIKGIDDFVEFLIEPDKYCERRALGYILGSKRDKHTLSLFEGRL